MTFSRSYGLVSHDFISLTALVLALLLFTFPLVVGFLLSLAC